MSAYGDKVDAILVKPARDWTPKETLVIDKLMKDHGRAAVQEALIQVRGGDKLQVVEE